MVKDTLRGLDKFKKPYEDDSTATVCGGVLTIFVPIATLIFMALYFEQLRTAEYPSTLYTKVFPGSDGQREMNFLPTTKCTASSGCWVTGFQSELQGGSTNGQPAERRCRYYQQGEELIDADRVIYYSSDPIDVLTVAWHSDSNFGLSYEVNNVVGYSAELDVQTTEAAGAIDENSANAYKIYKGSNLMSLVRTIGVDDTTVDTWTNTVTSEDGTPDTASNICCSSNTIYDSDNNLLTGSQYTNPCAEPQAYQTRIQPYPTYTEIDIIDPFDFNNWWPDIGGTFSMFDLIAGLVAGFYAGQVAKKKEKEEEEAAAAVEIVPTHKA
uniref:Uncharacterized protein n=1 Tax=Phaeomonas parva TaxID=124430 RepID=A0A7S1XKP2_9STRA|mmetsp:Transcript_12763/g.38300  ORF Transcript_12763/g.38300 Transcript_12763/m.38300 type:complete len:325 (+) Transcript_12763:128-1102(+)|eukprot:CAMPEP_0118863780 /NCGR_PEP_ID=MMETSP1163-20130328/8533_1 /TAXON_ID=124430 /ORGANISM="Phaeomonas parva, Strain CCMP2877" /LENGTH=324 /DNA_ID=CAMNT_0006797815 /DNA_START=124 /DNA_END=1098 /DNA_ORIENTATION=+